mgnify:CR=1 FL=1
MAKKSRIAKNNQRRILSERLEPKREELRKIIKSPASTHEQRDEAIMKLNKMPRDSSAIRVRNRCALTGRCRAYMRQFSMSRLCFRELASNGVIPGIVKASW